MRYYLLAAAMTCVLPAPAFAQAAAETATILTGTGPATGSASRSMGNSVGNAIGGAAAAVAAARGRSGGVTVQARHRGGAAAAGTMTRATNDPLEGTDATAYRLQNGATIRTSGRLVPSRQAACVENCEDAWTAPEE